MPSSAPARRTFESRLRPSSSWSGAWPLIETQRRPYSSSKRRAPSTSGASGFRCSRKPLTAPISTFSNPASASPRSASSRLYGLKQMLDPVWTKLTAVVSHHGRARRPPTRDQPRLAEPDLDARASRRTRGGRPRRRPDLRAERERRALEREVGRSRGARGRAADRRALRARDRGRHAYALRARQGRRAQPAREGRQEPEALPGQLPRGEAEGRARAEARGRRRRLRARRRSRPRDLRLASGGSRAVEALVAARWPEARRDRDGAELDNSHQAARARGPREQVTLCYLLVGGRRELEAPDVAVEVREALRVVPGVDQAVEHGRHALVVRAARTGERLRDVARLVDALGVGAARLCDGDEVDLRLEVRRDVPLARRALDPLAPAERRVVQHDPDDRRPVLHRRRKLLHVHLERAVAGHAHDVRVRPRQLRSDRGRDAEAHARLLGRRDAAAVRGHLRVRAVVRPEILAAVLVDEDVVAERIVQRVDDLLRLQRLALGRALVRDPSLELLLEGDELRRPRPRRGLDGARKLLEHEPCVAHDPDVGPDVAADLERVDVDLDDLRA